MECYTCKGSQSYSICLSGPSGNVSRKRELLIKMFRKFWLRAGQASLLLWLQKDSCMHMEKDYQGEQVKENQRKSDVKLVVK